MSPTDSSNEPDKSMGDKSVSQAATPPTSLAGEATDRAASAGPTFHRAGPPGRSLAQPAMRGPGLQSRQPPTSAEIDAVIAAAMANAPPAPPPVELGMETSTRSLTPLMTNILPSAIGSDGRVNLFVGNLPYRVRWQDLKDLFRKAGTVLRADVSLGPDNRSRGYGNVLMGSREDAARAIDRFNGFTWQTRTLEVRPDRLPPEYEPQPHVHHKPMYGFMGGPMHHFGGGGWPARPPHHGGPFGQFPHHHLGPPNHAGGPGPQPPFIRGPPPLPSHVTAQMAPIGASPLAGSLTAGPPGQSGPNAPGGGAGGGGPTWGAGAGGRDALGGGFGNHSLGDAALGRTASPANMGTLPSLGPLDGKRSASPANATEPIGRPPHPSRLGGPALFAPGGPKALASELDGPRRRQSGGSEGHTPPVNLVPGPIALNGLAGQAKDLGAPNTLYDRVVFVKNLSLTTQWQDLKDLFRPAGAVIRADVATGPDGQSRGYGTVLFASKDDALKAVTMLNGHEVDGRVLHVQTERQTLEDKQIQPIHPVNDPIASTNAKSRLPQQTGVWAPPSTQQLPPISTAAGPDPFPVATPAAANVSPNAGRVPWQLNTAVAETPPARIGDDGQPGRLAKHPGPISLPPFPSLGDVNPLSPLQTRNLPPMTPSMPGFVFNAYPQTPPLHSHFLSPGGAGPFSPGLPVTSPMFNRNPFLNPAPGAPVNVPQAGSAALGTPTTQEFPHNAPHSTAGPPGGQVPDEYFPRIGSPTRGPRPLNARERMGSTTAGDEALAAAASELSLSSRTADSSPTPKAGKHTRSASGAHTSSMMSPPATNGRSSFDDTRQPLAVGSGFNPERRASWSEVAGGQK